MATAERWKRWGVSFESRANGSGKSKLRLCERCGIRRASGSWKVSSKRRKLKGWGAAAFARATLTRRRSLIGDNETRRRSGAVGSPRPGSRAEDLAILRAQHLARNPQAQ